MRRIWVNRTIDAPTDVVWRPLVDTVHWPTWGPSVRDASVDGSELRLGATGSVETVGDVTLPLVVTEFVDGVSWGWRVAGVAATTHRVEAIDDVRCRAGFGVPWMAAPSAAMCHVALRRIEELATVSVARADAP